MTALACLKKNESHTRIWRFLLFKLENKGGLALSRRFLHDTYVRAPKRAPRKSAHMERPPIRGMLSWRGMICPYAPSWRRDGIMTAPYTGDNRDDSEWQQEKISSWSGCGQQAWQQEPSQVFAKANPPAQHAESRQMQDDRGQPPGTTHFSAGNSLRGSVFSQLTRLLSLVGGEVWTRYSYPSGISTSCRRLERHESTYKREHRQYLPTLNL